VLIISLLIRTPAFQQDRHFLSQRSRAECEQCPDRSVDETPWSEFVVCRHGDNDALLQLSEPVLGSSDALAALRSLTFTNAVRDWKAHELVELIHSCGANTGEWARWMRTR
jgi:hypothetical protein